MYEVFALKYGERDTTKCQFFYRESSHEKLTLDYFVWLILGGPHPLLVDTGFLDDDARARGIRNYVSPAAMVERAGIKAGDIPISLITHLHYDHWAGHSLFPNAEFWIQGEEVAFWTGPFGRTPAFRGSANVDALARLVTLNYANKIRIVDGDHEVWPGIRVHRVGGHTAGLQIVTVETRRGTVPPGSRSSPSRPGAAPLSSPPTPRTSTTTWRRDSRSRSSRACRRCSRPLRRSTPSRAQRN